MTKTKHNHKRPNARNNNINKYEHYENDSDDSYYLYVSCEEDKEDTQSYCDKEDK